MISKSNLKILLICIGIASFFWLLNALGHEYISVINYPINIVYEDKSKKKKSFKELPKTIKIEVAAKGWYLLKFKFQKNEPFIIKVNKYKRRSYFTNIELIKLIKPQVKDFKLNKIVTKRLKIYEK